MKFVLSRGNPDAVAKARNTIIYAAVGLVISMLSFAIVRFVVRGLRTTLRKSGLIKLRK
jgi:uncharacterized membrane protein YjfL (UPF0719 family)